MYFYKTERIKIFVRLGKYFQKPKKLKYEPKNEFK